MREISLNAEPRDDRGTSNSRRMRREGRVPAVVYGLDDPTLVVSVDTREIQRLLAHGSNTLISLELDGDSQLTMAREVQRHPIKGEIQHVDFVRIRADRPVEADVPIHLIGEPEGLKEGGVLEHVLYEVTIEARPREIPEYIEIDVSELGVGEQKRVEDLVAPPGVELLTDPERVVANIVTPVLAPEAAPALSPEEAEELEGLSEEELEALAELAATREDEAPTEEALDAAAEAVEAEEPPPEEG